MAGGGGSDIKPPGGLPSDVAGWILLSTFAMALLVPAYRPGA